MINYTKICNGIFFGQIILSLLHLCKCKFDFPTVYFLLHLYKCKLDFPTVYFLLHFCKCKSVRITDINNRATVPVFRFPYYQL